MPSFTHRRARFGLLFFAIASPLVGCERKSTVEEQPKKAVESAPAVKPSVSAAPVVVAVTNPRCVNGAPVTGTPSGGSEATLGSVFSPLRLVGQTLRVEGGLTEPDAEKVLCAAYKDFAPCFDDVATKTKLVGVALYVAAGGGVTGTKPIGEALGLGDDAFESCLNDVATKLSFAKTEKGGRVSYALLATKTKSLKMLGSTTSAGTYPVEKVNRLVRANYARLRPCYENGLKKDAKLKGTVTTTFTIDDVGGVEGAKNAGGTLTDANVRACLAGVFATMSFPAPEKGKAAVTYAIEFAVEDWP